MLDRDPEELAVRSTVQASIHGVSNIAVVLTDFFLVRPVTGLVVWKISRCGINAEGKEVVERFLLGLHSKGIRAYQIPIKRIQVAEVEGDAMALRDRSIVESVGLNQLKQIVRQRPGITKM